jgi:hypothetical protein
MEDLIHIQKTFEKVTFINKKVNNREFEDCTFKNCDSNSDFSQYFLDCEFIDCNSMTQLRGTSLKTVNFSNCKLGIEFQSCTDSCLVFLWIAFWITLPLLTRKCLKRNSITVR